MATNLFKDSEPIFFEDDACERCGSFQDLGDMSWDGMSATIRICAACHGDLASLRDWVIEQMEAWFASNPEWERTEQGGWRRALDDASGAAAKREKRST